ncbi:hypothetical protein V6N13_051522 [Hibiscus sabdariffa]
MKGKKPPLKLSLPSQANPITSIKNVIVQDDESLLNQKGSCSISEEKECPVDFELSLDDLETVKVIGKGSGGGTVYLVLEYMDRGSLADVVRQVKTIAEPYLAAMCKQVLQGLVYLQQEKNNDTQT